MKAEVGQKIILKHSQTEQEQSARVVRISPIPDEKGRLALNSCGPRRNSGA